MTSLTPDVLFVIASFLDSKSIMSFGLVCRETMVLVPFARRVLDRRSYQCVDGRLNKCVCALNTIRDEHKRVDLCVEILHNLDKAVMQFVIYGSINMYVSQYGDDTTDPMKTSALKDALDIMRSTKKDCNVPCGAMWSKLTPSQKKAWSLFEDFWLGQRTYVNLTWVVETMEGDETEVSINIGSSDNENNVGLTIYNGGEVIPVEQFDINDTQEIVSFVQENTYVRFFEDAKYQWLLLKNDAQDNIVNVLRGYDYIRPSIDTIMNPIHRLMM
jgi:hypothetical protein